jgi:hypothetical protein
MGLRKGHMNMIERENEFEIWPGHFLDNHRSNYPLSLIGWPSATFRVVETYMDIHRRLGQVCILGSATDRHVTILEPY